MHSQLSFLLTVLLLVATVSLWGKDEKRDYSFFESKIRPVLATKCYECHSSEASKIKGGLRLDHIDLILKGGDTGPALVIAKPAESLILEAIGYDEPDFQMPPKERLSKQVVDDFSQWIAEGAIWPSEPVPTLPPKVIPLTWKREKVPIGAGNR